jgi:hypothetical protein
VVSEPTFHNSQLQVMDDHRLHQLVHDILQKFQKKLNEAFARVESCFAEYKYEFQCEQKQLALYSLQPTQINLHPYDLTTTKPVRSENSITQPSPKTDPITSLEVPPSKINPSAPQTPKIELLLSPPWVVNYSWKRTLYHHGATPIVKQHWLQIRSPGYHHVMSFTQRSLVEERLNPLSERPPRKRMKRTNHLLSLRTRTILRGWECYVHVEFRSNAVVVRYWVC